MDSVIEKCLRPVCLALSHESFLDMERTSYYLEYIRQKWFQIDFDAKR